MPSAVLRAGWYVDCSGAGAAEKQRRQSPDQEQVDPDGRPQQEDRVGVAWPPRRQGTCRPSRPYRGDWSRWPGRPSGSHGPCRPARRFRLRPRDQRARHCCAWRGSDGIRRVSGRDTAAQRRLVQDDGGRSTSTHGFFVWRLRHDRRTRMAGHDGERRLDARELQGKRAVRNLFLSI
jgi:hypothetical protein